jgi:RNA polymerase sigma-70 factor (ECF subfamily)
MHEETPMPEPDHSADADLLARIRAGDRAACALCIDRYAPGMYRLALRLTGNEADAEDVVQEALESAFKGVAAFEGRASLQTWLFRITHNAALMRLRRHRPLLVDVHAAVNDGATPAVPEQLFDWCCLPEADFQTAEVRAALEAAIGALPETLRGTFLLRELEGLSTQETAEALDVSSDVVKTRLRRARLQLRELLANYFAEQHA